MRGAPHVGFSATIRKIKSRTPFDVGILPTRALDFGNQPPVQTESGPVPADYGFGRDDDEGLLPTGPDPPSNYPEDFIEDAEARTTMSTF